LGKENSMNFKHGLFFKVLLFSSSFPYRLLFFFEFFFSSDFLKTNLKSN